MTKTTDSWLPNPDEKALHDTAFELAKTLTQKEAELLTNPAFIETVRKIAIQAVLDDARRFGPIARVLKK